MLPRQCYELIYTIVQTEKIIMLNVKKWSLGALVILQLSSYAYASGGDFFELRSIENQLGFAISTTVPNHQYTCAGVQIAGDGIQLSNTDSECDAVVNGFCRFHIKQGEIKRFTHQALSKPTNTEATVCLNVCGNRPISCEKHTSEVTFPAIKQLVSVGSYSDTTQYTRFPLVYTNGTNNTNWKNIFYSTLLSDISLDSVYCINNNCVTFGKMTASGGISPYSATSSDGGTSWVDSTTQPSLPPNISMIQSRSLSCFGSSTCVAVGNYTSTSAGSSAGVYPISFISSDSGVRFSSSSVSFTLQSAFSNASSSVTTGYANYDYVNGLACAGTRCVAVGSFAPTGSAATTPTATNYPLSYISNDSGITWTTPEALFTLPNSTTSATLNAVACDTSTASTCFAVGNYFTTPGSGASAYAQPLIYTTTNSGTTWTLTNTPALPSGALGADLTSITCNITADTCVAAGNYTTSTGTLAPVVYEYSNSTWSIATEQPVVTDLVAPIITGVGCYFGSSIACTVIGSTGTTVLAPLSFYSANIAASPWTNTSPSTSGRSGSILLGINCDAGTTTPPACVIVGDYTSGTTLSPIIYTSNDSGITTSTITLPDSTFSSSELTAVSCDSTSVSGICSAVGDYYTNLGPNAHPLAEYSMDGGYTWSQVSVPSLETNVSVAGQLNDVSCTAAKCVTAGQYATSSSSLLPLSYYSTNNGYSWTLSSVELPSGQTIGALNSVSCNQTPSSSSIACVTGGYSSTTGGSNLPLIAVSIDNGQTWMTPQNLSLPSGTQSAEIVGIECNPLVNICYALASSMTNDASVVPLIYRSTNGGNTWSTLTQLTLTSSTSSAELADIKCDPTAKTCIAVGYYTELVTPSLSFKLPLIYRTINGGNSWAVATPIRNQNATATVLTSLTCEPLSATCVASGYYDDKLSAIRKPIRYISTDNGITWIELPALVESPTSITNIINGSN